MSIQETLLKIKGQGRYLRIAGESLAIILIISGAFAIGHATALKPKVILEKPTETVPSAPLHLEILKEKPSEDPKIEDKAADRRSAAETPNPSPSKNPSAEGSWAFAASKSGKVYYPKDCKAVSRVKPENRITFTSESQAISKGLTKSKSCT